MKLAPILAFTSLLAGAPVAACELPTDPDHAQATRQQERVLTRRALARADTVVVATVRAIEHDPETDDPATRESTVSVDLVETLKAPPGGPPAPAFRARLHHVIMGCFGNEAFWDDQVEVGGEYLFFVADGRILSVAADHRGDDLGLEGRREVVRQVLDAQVASRGDAEVLPEPETPAR